MAACLIIGDSIAAGIAAALSTMHPAACDVRVRVGASVGAIVSMAPTASYQFAIISAGSNDRGNRNLAADLERLRTALKAKAITWLYPRASPEAWAVYRVARKRGDRAIGLGRIGSQDGVHPNSYDAAVSIVFKR
jgi:hypothetical protein